MFTHPSTLLSLIVPLKSSEKPSKFTIFTVDIHVVIVVSAKRKHENEKVCKIVLACSQGAQVVLY